MGCERRLWRALAVGALVLVGVSCRSAPRRFPLAGVVWQAGDELPLDEVPEATRAPGYTDGADKLVLDPLVRLFAFEQGRPAMNVNALDEVPNGAWFTNRLGQVDLSPARVAQGPCDTPDPRLPEGDLTVVGGKPDGGSPGFLVEDAEGTRYLFKVDGPKQVVRGSAADVVGSRIWWAAGYHVPCNFIAHVEPNRFVIAAGAKAKDLQGRERPMSERDLARMLSLAVRRPDGRLRILASRLLDGEIIGPFTFQGVREDDPNDLIPHEHRRELRGMHWLSAWVSHVDFRDGNTLDAVVEEGGRRFVRHHVLDWGDSLGVFYPPYDLMRRIGRSYVIDYGQIVGDLVTLGMLDRPWKRTEAGPAEVFAHYATDLDPEQWRPIYEIPASRLRDHRDDLWMARILARFTDEHVKAIVATAKLPHPVYEEELVRTLSFRRDRILAHVLLRHAPLDRFRLARRRGDRQQHLCFEDLALLRGLTSWQETFYNVWIFGGEQLDHELGWAHLKPDPRHPTWSCMPLPPGIRRPADLAPADAPADDPRRYAVARIYVHQEGALFPRSRVDLHFYDLGPSQGMRLVGIHHPEEPGDRPVD